MESSGGNEENIIGKLEERGPHHIVTKSSAELDTVLTWKAKFININSYLSEIFKENVRFHLLSSC